MLCKKADEHLDHILLHCPLSCIRGIRCEGAGVGLVLPRKASDLFSVEIVLEGDPLKAKRL